MNNTSIESIVVGFGLDGVLFDILRDKCLGKFVENVVYLFSFLDTFMENHNDFVFLNQLMSFLSGQVEFSCNEQKLSNVINSLNTLFENTFRFQFYHLHFKEFLLKDFENRMGANLELFKVNPLAFEKSTSRKEAFEQVCKDFGVGHLYYHRPFKEWDVKSYANIGKYVFCVEMSAFEMGSFHGLTRFYVRFIKDLSTIARSLVDVTKKMTGETRSPHLEFSYHSSILYFSFEVDYDQFEGFDNEEQAPKLFIVSTVSKDYLRQQFGCEKGARLRSLAPTANGRPYPVTPHLVGTSGDLKSAVVMNVEVGV
ncbi:hypothetical protein M9H77_17762 [Catharanthus roseus]|uniref:Uncharacterized protein n=1 Tax=Catharanthus roseus TaxID=4058 RepID=A0ACC0B5I9_CATRO|nr:hypothetical protein M9H77_17762 [Catharanthus roseus]